MILRKYFLAMRHWHTIAMRFLRRITGVEGIKNKMPENKHEILGPVLAAGAVSALGAALVGAYKYDQFLGDQDVQGIEPEDPRMFIHERPGATTAFVLIGGFCMGRSGVAKRFDSQLANNVNMYAPLAPDAGFNPETMYEETYQELDRMIDNMDVDIDEFKLVVLGLSMGGRLEIGFVNYGFSSGRERLLANYTASFSRTPIGNKNIRRKPRLGLNALGKLGNSRLLHRARRLLNDEGDVKSIATAPTTRIVQEARYLLRNDDKELTIRPKRTVWFRGMQDCPVTNEDGSISEFQKANHLAVEQYFDKDCVERKHMPTNKRAAWYILNHLHIAKPKAEPVTRITPTQPLMLHPAA